MKIRASAASGPARPGRARWQAGQARQGAGAPFASVPCRRVALSTTEVLSEECIGALAKGALADLGVVSLARQKGS